MKKPTRLLLATGAGVLGALVLGYWIYAIMMARAVAHMLEAFGLPVQSSQSLSFYLLPIAGISLIIVAICFLVLPAVHRKFANRR